MRGISIFLLLTRVVVLAAAADSARERGITAFGEGRYRVALEELGLAAKNPDDRAARLFLALTEAAMQNCGAALPVLREEQAEQTLTKLAGLAAARCEEAAGDHLSALGTLTTLGTKFPNDADVLYLEAKLHMKAFNDTTYAMFQRTPASYRVHELSAEVFETENRFAEAVQEYKRAIELNADAPDLHYRLGRALLLATHTAESLRLAKEAFGAELRVSPEDGASEFQLGQIEQAEGNGGEAKRHFLRALTLTPQFGEAMIALGKVETEEKNFDRAIELLERAAALEPANERVHYALLTAYRNTGQMDKARAEKAILDRLQKPPEGEFSDFLKKLGEPQPK